MNIRLSEAQKRQSYTSPESIAAMMHRVLLRENRLSRSQEHFWVLGLNNANQLLYIELIALGRQNRVAVNPPDVFRTAIHQSALKVVLVHNHPSGRLDVSEGDKSVTGQLLKVGELMGIEVLDHLIITETDNFLSMRTEGLLKELQEGQGWRLIRPDEHKQQRVLQEYKQQELILETQYHTRRTIAQKLKGRGMDEGIICQATGLRLMEIRRL